eukprot:293360_1
MYKLQDVSIDVYIYPWTYSGYYYYLIGPDPNTTSVYGYSQISKPLGYIFDIADYFNANWIYYNGQSFVDDINLIIKQCNTQPPTFQPTQTTIYPTNIPTISPTQSPTSTPTSYPTLFPSISPTLHTNIPSYNPSINPTQNTLNPSTLPTVSTLSPTESPTLSPLPIYNEICISQSAHSVNYNGVYKYSNWSLTEQGAMYKLQDVSIDVYIYPWTYSGYYYYLIGPDPNTTSVYGYSQISKPLGYIFDIADYFNANWIYYNGQSFVDDINLVIKKCDTQPPTFYPTDITLNPSILPTVSPITFAPTVSPTSLPTPIPTTSSPTQNPTVLPTLSPTTSPTIKLLPDYDNFFNKPYLRAKVDVYPISNVVTTHPLQLQITNNTYRDITIYFKILEYQCYYPKISLKYEQTILQNNSERISVIHFDYFDDSYASGCIFDRDSGKRCDEWMETCNGVNDINKQCDVFSECISDHFIGKEIIEIGSEERVRIWVRAKVNADCNEYHPWSINVVLTLICGLTPAPTTSPTISPTEMPTTAPSTAPTPTDDPTPFPTTTPTNKPIPAPTGYPTLKPSYQPTHLPTPSPTTLALIMYVDKQPNTIWIILTISFIVIVIVIMYYEYRKYMNVYIMQNVLVLIIGITEFDDKNLNLPNDVNNIAKIITLWQNMYKYDVRLCNYSKNSFYCTKKDVIHFIDENLVELNTYDGVIIHIFTHGQNGNEFLTSDGKNLKLAFIKHELNEASQNMCMKIVFYHSCRGNVSYHLGQNADELLYKKSKCCCCCCRKTKKLPENIEMTRVSMRAVSTSKLKNANNIFTNNDNTQTDANCVVLFGNIDDRATSSQGYFTQSICDSFGKNAKKFKKKDFVELIIGFNGLCRNLVKLSNDAEICTTKGIGTMVFGKKIRFEVGKNKSNNNHKIVIDNHKIVIRFDEQETKEIVFEDEKEEDLFIDSNACDNVKKKKLEYTKNDEEDRKEIEYEEKDDMKQEILTDRNEKNDSVTIDSMNFIYNDQDYGNFIAEYTAELN